MGSLWELTNALSDGTIPDPLRTLSLDWRFTTPTQNSIAIISGTGKATDFKFGHYIPRVHQNKSPLKILEKREHGRIQGLSNFLKVPTIISGMSKATNFKFCMHIHRVDGNKIPLKLEKSTVGVLRDSQKFSGHPYIGRITRSSLR